MKKFLIRLAFLPFVLAIAFAAKVYFTQFWHQPHEHPVITDINHPSPYRINTENPRHVQVALLLDISGSMDGLIEQAKAKLWKIVNQLADARYGDEIPELEIALYVYGGDNLSVSNGYVKQLTPLTTDLDLISEKLFELTTNGGEEYCGKVIGTSLSELSWSDSKEDLKMIFIAGNEPFTQGPVPFQEVCRQAAEREIFVNTIFCGDYMEGINTQWKAGAVTGKGQYLNIDHNQAVTYIETPYDQEISDLNDELNTTYIHYGANGAGFYSRQSAEDAKASSFSQANKVQRGISKSKKAYKNESWDLVDASKEKNFDLKKVEKQTLPEAYRSLSTDSLLVKIKETDQKRQTVQKKIRDLDLQRKAFIASQQKENAETQTLDHALIKTIKDQANRKAYKFE